MMPLNPGIRDEEERKFVFSVALGMLSKRSFVLLGESNARSVKCGTNSHECASLVFEPFMHTAMTMIFQMMTASKMRGKWQFQKD